MDFSFALMEPEEVIELYAPPVPIPAPPQIPPEVWQTKPADPDRCWDATRAMCH